MTECEFSTLSQPLKIISCLPNMKSLKDEAVQNCNLSVFDNNNSNNCN